MGLSWRPCKGGSVRGCVHACVRACPHFHTSISHRILIMRINFSRLFY